MKRLNNLEVDHLLRLCKKYGIDPAEVDSGLSYTENKLHLNRIVKMVTHTVSTRDVESLARAPVEEREQWINEHFLDYFLVLQMYGEATVDIGQAPAPLRPFSLHEFIEITKRRDYGQFNSADNGSAKA